MIFLQITLYLIAITFAVLLLFRAIKKLRSQYRRDKKKLLKVGVVILTVVILINFYSLYRVFSIDAMEKEQYNAENAAPNTINFEQDIINMESTIWEMLQEKNFLYSYYNEWGNEVSSNFELRMHYINHVAEDRFFLLVTLDDIKEIVSEFYGTALLPTTNRSIEEVTLEIPPLETRYSADANIFIEEFIIRFGNCTDSSSFDCIFQAARAADDAYKCLVHNTMDSEFQKSKMLMSALAISLYQICLQKYSIDATISKEFIQYRMAELFIYTYEHTPPNDNNANGITNKFYIHCLLSAEALLKAAYNSYVYKHPSTDIHKNLPFIELYLADIEYDMIVLYGFNYDLLINECQNHATNYQNSKYCRDKESCIYIINMLNMLTVTQK